MKKTLVLLVFSLIFVFSAKAETLCEKLDRKVNQRSTLYDEIKEIQDILTTIVVIKKKEEAFKIWVYGDPILKIQRMYWDEANRRWTDSAPYNEYYMVEGDTISFDTKHWPKIEKAINELINKK